MIRPIDLTPDEIRYVLEALESYAMKGLVGAERTHNSTVLPKLHEALGGGADWVEFESSNLKRARYSSYANVLVIEFNSGAVWHYLDFPREAWDEFLAAESKGKFFRSNVLDAYTAIPEATPDDGAE